MKFNFERIHEHIGYLLYGVASGKGRLSPVDLMKLAEIIEKIWRPSTKVESNIHMHLTDCIHQGVKYASDNSMSFSNAIESFATYFTIHYAAFSNAIKDKILLSLTEISNEFPVKTDHTPFTKSLHGIFQRGI